MLLAGVDDVPAVRALRPFRHWELVANGNELTLYLLDDGEKPLQAGKTYNVDFIPTGGNTWKAVAQPAGLGARRTWTSFKAKVVPKRRQMLRP